MTIIRLSDRSDRQSKSGIVSSKIKSTKSKSGGVTPIFKALSTNDFEKISIPDMMDELSRNSHLYYIDKKDPQADWVSIRNLPDTITNLTSSLKPKLNTERPPGVRTCLCLFLTHGLEILSANESIQLMIQVRDKLFNHTLLGTAQESYVMQVVKTSVQMTKESGHRVNVPATEWVSNTVARLSKDLGIDANLIAVMAMYAYLTTQHDYCPDSYVDLWSGLLDDFLLTIEMKSKGVDMMMKVIYGS
jgi:hypothetical protein